MARRREGWWAGNEQTDSRIAAQQGVGGVRALPGTRHTQGVSGAAAPCSVVGVGNLVG